MAKRDRKVATEEEVMNLRAVFERREQQRSRLSLCDRLRDLVRVVVSDRQTGRTSRQRDRAARGAELVPDANDSASGECSGQDSEPATDDDETAGVQNDE